MRRPGIVLSAALLLLPGLASGLNCTITLTPLAFGLYQPGQMVPVDAVANITVRCVAEIKDVGEGVLLVALHMR